MFEPRGTASPDPLAIQESEYRFPYHFIPALAGRDIVYSVAIDWAADGLNGIELVRSTVQRLGARRVCDVGCGDGRLISELSAMCPGVKFSGIDVSTRALALANLFRTRDNANASPKPPPFVLRRSCFAVRLHS